MIWIDLTALDVPEHLLQGTMAAAAEVEDDVRECCEPLIKSCFVTIRSMMRDNHDH